MAADLAYKDLPQVNLDKFYMPQGHFEDAELRRKVIAQLHRVLENTERFVVASKSDAGV
jgi:hypothetical protein